MGKVGRFITLLLVAIAALGVVYMVFRAVASWRQGYSWEEMDWHQRGSTSLGDLFAASDIGKRNVEVNGKQCIEYYAYKDGLPVKTVCQK